MGILLNRAQVAAKIESVEGTAENLSNSDAFLVFTPKADTEVERYKRDPVRENLGQLESLPGARSAKLSFTVELAGSGTAGTAPAWGKLMKACGCSETVVPATSVTYAPASASIPSMTLALYMDGVIKKIWGARGTFQLVLEKGKPGLLNFTFTGADYSVTDGSLLTGVSYSTVKPPVFLGVTFTYDSYAARIAKLSLDAGNTLALTDDITKSSGHFSALITERAPRITFDPELVTVATKDFFGQLVGNAGKALSLSGLGSSGGNTIALSVPKCQIEEVKLGDRKGYWTLEIAAGAAMSSGDDDWSLVLT